MQAFRRMASRLATNLNSPSLANGSNRPPRPTDKLRVYNMRFCPFAQRALLALEAKGIPYEIVNIHLQDKPDWFEREINPLAKVPVIETAHGKGEIIYESLVCVDWLEESFPNTKALLPSDSYERAKQKMLLERISWVTSAFYGVIRNLGNQEKLDKLYEALGLCEKLLEKDFFAGSQPGWVDYMQWPWLERLHAITKPPLALAIPRDRFPKMWAYFERMLNRDEIKAVVRSPEEHIAFMQSFTTGKPNYDLGITAKQ